MRSATTRISAAIVALGLLAAACSDGPDPPPGILVADGYQLEVVATGFDRPTQLTATGEAGLVIAQLAGGENDRSGQVVLMNEEFDDRVVLQRNLDKPTGVAVIGDRLFIQLRDALVFTELIPSGALRPLELDQPSNGRSQGSLSVTPDGDLLFNTSGAKRGAERVTRSGILWRRELDGSTIRASEQLAEGFKHAYAHTHTADGRLFVVEMTDGTFDGERGSDELVVVEAGDDAGWPFCVDDNRPVAEFGGSAERCADAPRSHALFGPGATPTAVVVAPWDPDLLLVTLWIPGQIVAVPTTAQATPHEGVVVVDGIESPQSLLVDGDRVLVVDHETGTIFALTAG